MVNEINEKNKAKITHLIANPKDLEELKSSLEELKESKKKDIAQTSANVISNVTGSDLIWNSNSTPVATLTYVNPDIEAKKRKHFFSNIRSLFSGKKN